jgi:ATP-dependent RNA helicase RhlE
MDLAGRYMKEPFRVEASRSGSTAVKVHQQMYVMRTSLKPLLTLKLLEEHTGQVLIFVETRYDASKVASIIHHAKFSVAELHSDRSMGQRQEAMEGFRNGKYRVLVATDIAARGIDVTGIEMVINYDIPAENDAYVHRIGRTGRAGKDGLAITFVRPDQGSDVKSIEELTGVKIEMMKHPAIPEEKLWGYEHAAANRGWNQSATRRRR